MHLHKGNSYHTQTNDDEALPPWRLRKLSVHRQLLNLLWELIRLRIVPHAIALAPFLYLRHLAMVYLVSESATTDRLNTQDFTETGRVADYTRATLSTDVKMEWVETIKASLARGAA